MCTLISQSIDDSFLVPVYEPRLSAAMMTPSLYLIANTDVPVTIGARVCCIGAAVCRNE